MDRANVDTDLIIPKQFLKSIKRSGFGPNLFDELRYLDEGQPGQDCSNRPLNPVFCSSRRGNWVASIERVTGTVPTNKAEWDVGLSEYHDFRDDNPGVSCEPRTLRRPGRSCRL